MAEEIFGERVANEAAAAIRPLEQALVNFQLHLLLPGGDAFRTGSGRQYICRLQNHQDLIFDALCLGTIIDDQSAVLPTEDEVLSLLQDAVAVDLGQKKPTAGKDQQTEEAYQRASRKAHNLSLQTLHLLKRIFLAISAHRLRRRRTSHPGRRPFSST